MNNGKITNMCEFGEKHKGQKIIGSMYCTNCAPQVDKNQSKEFKYDTLEIQKLVGEQINRNYSWNLPQSNTMDEVRKEFYKSFKDFKELTTIDSICIADWWLEKLSQVRKETLAMVLKEIEKIENQKVIFRTFGGCKCNFNQGDIIQVDENNIHTTCGGELPMQVPIQSPLDTLKTKLQAKE